MKLVKAKKKRQQLEDAINILLCDFTVETGLRVDEVVLETSTWSMADYESVTYRAYVKALL